MSHWLWPQYRLSSESPKQAFRPLLLFSALLFWKSSLPPSPLSRLTSLHAGLFARGIVECHHIPGWHSCLDIAEVQALARAACRDETGTGSQGLSAHLLPEPAREPSFITSTDAKSSSCHSGDILSHDCCKIFCHKSACLSSGCAAEVFSPFFLFNPSNLFVFADPISEGKTLGNSIPLLPSALSHICHITPLRHLGACRGRLNHAASFSSLTPTLKADSVVWNIYQTCVFSLAANCWAPLFHCDLILHLWLKMLEKYCECDPRCLTLLFLYI